VDGRKPESSPDLVSLERKRVRAGHGSAGSQAALVRDPRVSLTIDDNTFPHKVLLVRGEARLETVNGIVPDYALAAEQYFGREQGQAWVAQLSKTVSSMVRVSISPKWVGLLDFQTRFPSALSH
jgi:hypothetical protein